LLRSFADEEKLNYVQAARAFFDFSLESRLASDFAAVGPFIAVGAPHDTLPHLGAIRAQLSDTEWQGSVTKWMDEAAIVVLMAGTTHWIVWELKKVIDLGHVGKLVLLFPEITTRRKWFRRIKGSSADERLAMVRQQFQGTVWSQALEVLPVSRRIRSMSFEPDGRVVVVTSRPHNRESYHLSALVADDVVRQHRTGSGEERALSVGVGQTAELEHLASMRARGVAAVLDAALLAAAFGALESTAATSASTVNAVLAAVIAALSYYSLSEGLAGSTVGKAIVGLSVRTGDGGPCGLARAVRRNLLRFVDAIGFYVVGFVIASSSPQRQRLGDRWAGTVVVRTARAWIPRAAWGFVWVVVCLAGSVPFAANIPDLAAIVNPLGPMPRDIPVNATGRLRAGGFRFVEGRDGPTRATNVYRPGDVVQVSYDVAGFAKDGQRRAKVHAETRMQDPSGLDVVEPRSALFHDRVRWSVNINEWVQLPLPSYAPPGEYRLDITIRDDIGQGILRVQPRFRVEGHAAPPPRELEIRELGLSLSEDGTAPSDGRVVLNGGGKVYMTCVVVGLTFHGDHPDGKVRLDVMAPDGRAIVVNPDFAAFKEPVFYHPASLPLYVRGELTIPRGSVTGTYTVRYTVVDRISGRSAARAANFDVN